MKKTMKLTRNQRELLERIEAYITENWHAPTLKELAEAKGVSINSVAEMLKAMQKKGAIDWTPGQARTLRVTKVALKESDNG